MDIGDPPDGLTCAVSIKNTKRAAVEFGVEARAMKLDRRGIGVTVIGCLYVDGKRVLCRVIGQLIAAVRFRQNGLLVKNRQAWAVVVVGVG